MSLLYEESIEEGTGGGDSTGYTDTAGNNGSIQSTVTAALRIFLCQNLSNCILQICAVYCMSIAQCLITGSGASLVEALQSLLNQASAPHRQGWAIASAGAQESQV